MPESLLTVEELARWIGKTPKAIYDLRYRGEPGTLPLGIEIGGSLHYDPADVREWLNEQKEQAKCEQRDRIEAIHRFDARTRKRATAGKQPARISLSHPTRQARDEHR